MLPKEQTLNVGSKSTTERQQISCENNVRLKETTVKEPRSSSERKHNYPSGVTIHKQPMCTQTMHIRGAERRHLGEKKGLALGGPLVTLTL